MQLGEHQQRLVQQQKLKSISKVQNKDKRCQEIKEKKGEDDTMKTLHNQKIKKAILD